MGRREPEGTEGRRREARHFGTGQVGRADPPQWREDGWRAVARASGTTGRT